MVKKVLDSEKIVKKLKATKNKVKKAKQQENTEETENSVDLDTISDEEAAKLSITNKDSKDTPTVHWKPVAKTEEKKKKGNNNFYAKCKDFFHF